MTTSTSLLRSLISIFAVLAVVAFGNVGAAAAPNVAGIASSPVEPIQHPQSAPLAPALLSGASVGVPKTAGHAVYNLPSTDPFTDTGVVLPGVQDGSVAWGDYDNDGNLDLLVTGHPGSYDTLTTLYHNNGDGTFAYIGAAGLAQVAYSSVAWGDYDNDGHLDLLLSGFDSWSGTYIAQVYHNNGNGTFTDIGAGLTGVEYSSVAWGDYDNDGRLDLVLTGCSNYSYSYCNTTVAKVYHNNGNGTFTDINAGLTGVANGSVAWGDYDNDGRLDLVLTGCSSYSSSYCNTRVATIYHNNGDGTFTDINAGLTGVYQSSVAWGDYNNDGRLDLVLTGLID